MHRSNPRNLISKFEQKKEKKKGRRAHFRCDMERRKKTGGEEGLVPVIINREIGVIRIFALEDGRGGRRDDRFLYNMGCFAKFLRYSKRLSTKEF